jgi:spermidine synthase
MVRGGTEALGETNESGVSPATRLGLNLMGTSTTTLDLKPVTNTAGIIPYAVSVFMSATLLFLIQPIVAKQLLPWFGGGAGVWLVCLVFFQTVLLFGYWYAHWSVESLSRKAQVLTHIALLVLSTLAVCLTRGAQSHPAVVGHPALVALSLLASSIGAPYFVLSSTSPLLQAWFAAPERGSVPYRLFALSNLGSLLALLAYPFVIEPTLDTRVQIELWRVAYAVFALACAWVALRAWRVPTACPVGQSHGRFRAGAGRRATWVLLPACACMLLLAVTNELCQDIAPVPLLWIAPLAIYLASFILCFEYEGLFRPRVYTVLVPLALMAVLLIPAHPDIRTLGVPIFLSGLFVLCMFCHGQLVQLKPESRGLTSFYLSVSLGGALGGLFAGLLAPAIFPDYFELRVAVSIGLVLFLRFLLGYSSKTFLAICGSLALVLLYISSGLAGGTILFRGRNFYGVLSVREKNTPAGKVRTMYHGTTAHGGQVLTDALRGEPGYYYGRESGVGIALLAPATARRVGIVGLGVGTIAAYGRPGDVYRFYELNPMVERLARSSFTFLRDSNATVQTVPGDARLSLEGEPPQNFDVLILDAFSGDSVPVHLLTREAFQCYFRHLKADGVIAVHISSNYLDLDPVVTNIAAAFGRIALRVRSAGQPDREVMPAEWILITRQGEFSSKLESKKLAEILAPTHARLWTDQYSNIVGVLRP